jgi:hypothetical protein
LGGVKYDHLLFSRPGVDFQVWIAEGKKPWPARYIVTETGTPALLSITTVLRDWNLAPAEDDARFNFVPPKGAQAISFMPLETTGGSNRWNRQEETMKTTGRIAGAVIILFLLFVADLPNLSEKPVPEAQAFRGLGAAFVVGAAVGSAGSSAAAASAQQQAAIEREKTVAAQQQAALAQQPAALAQQPAVAPGRPLPLGTIVSALPGGCVSTPSGGVNYYYYCGIKLRRAELFQAPAHLVFPALRRSG